MKHLVQCWAPLKWSTRGTYVCNYFSGVAELFSLGIMQNLPTLPRGSQTSHLWSACLPIVLYPKHMDSWTRQSSSLSWDYYTVPLPGFHPMWECLTLASMQFPCSLPGHSEVGSSGSHSLCMPLQAEAIFVFLSQLMLVELSWTIFHSSARRLW